MMRAFNFRLDEQTHADILAMAKHVGKPGNLTAGAVGIFAEWRRLKTAHEAAIDFAAHIARQEDRLDAMDRRANAEGR